MEMNINENPTLSLNIVNAEDGIGMNIQTGGGGTKDHSKLQNLDYEHAGHTGFASSNDVKVTVGADTYNNSQAFADFLIPSLQSAFNDVWEDVGTKYKKPVSGIPKSDLDSSVQASLGKADTAIQSHQDISGKEDKTNKTTTLSSSSTDTQYPSAKAVYDYGDLVFDLGSYNVGDTISNATDVAKLKDERTIIYYNGIYYRLAAIYGSGYVYTTMSGTDHGQWITLNYRNDYNDFYFYENGTAYWEVPSHKAQNLTNPSSDTYPSTLAVSNALASYIQNTDYATTTGTAGVIKVGASYGTSISNTGYLAAYVMDYDRYGTVGNGAMVGKGTLETVLSNETLMVKDTQITNDTDLTTLDTGIYIIDDVQNHPDFPISSRSFGVLIQYPGDYKPQMFLAGYAGECKLYYRRWLTASSSFTTWAAPGITVDSALNSTSTNPVQNQALYKGVVGNQVNVSIPMNLWSTPSGSNFYNTVAIVTLPANTFTDNCTMELLNYEGFNMYAKHGFVLYGYEVESQRIWITAHNKPNVDITLKMMVYNYE